MPLAMASYHYGHYGMSKAELRKSNKPIMEKRRRARINTCLNELKTLILDATKKDPARHSKLEKADILEMTVKHLQEIQREEMTSAVSADPSVLTKFHSGFTECATEVSRYVAKLDGVDDGVKRRLMGHLNGCVSGLSQVLPLATSHSTSSEDLNNNTAQRLLSGLQLVPSRLPSGELAILLPSVDHRHSAFKTVVSAKSPVSHQPPLSPTNSTMAGDDVASEHDVTSTSPEIVVPIPQHPVAAGFVRTPPHEFKAEPTDAPSTSSEVWRPW